MAEPDNIPDDGYVFAAKRRKGIGKDLNPNSFWMDMPFLLQTAKAKEENPNWGAKKILKDRHRVYCPVPPSLQMPTSNDVGI
jgi:hypothetical protein